MKQADGPTAILEVVYRTTAHWAHPIRRAIEGNPILAKRDEGLEKQTIEVGEILKTRTGFCDECCRSEKNLLDGLVVVERKGSAALSARGTQSTASSLRLSSRNMMIRGKYVRRVSIANARSESAPIATERLGSRRVMTCWRDLPGNLRGRTLCAVFVEISSTSARCFLLLTSAPPGRRSSL